MLKIAKLTDYAFVVLGTLVEQGRGKVSAAWVSQQSGLPEPTVGKILKTLARGGIVESVRGANGGYFLSGDADHISVADVIIAMEGPIALTACVEGSEDQCTVEHKCPMKGQWSPVNMIIQTALETVSLRDIVRLKKDPAGLDISKEDIKEVFL